MFTRSAVTPPKVNWFEWNMEHSEYIVMDWLWQILGAICAVATAGEPGEILFVFCPVRMRDFADFLSAKFQEIWTQQRRPVRRWKLLEQNFENFTIRGRFFPKNAKISHKILTSCDFRPPELRNDYRSPEIHYQISFLPLESVQSHSPGQYSPYMVCTPKFFGHVGCGLTTRRITLTSLSRRQPITVDYWVTCRPRRVQEVNSLCTDSRALWAECCVVGIRHNAAI